MELSSLYSKDNHEAGAEMVVKGEDGKPTPLIIILRGLDSEAYREGNRRMRRKVLNAMSSEGGLDSLDETAEDIQTFVDLTVSWKGTDEPFSADLCKELYTKAPYIRDQVDSFVGKRANFIKG